MKIFAKLGGIAALCLCAITLMGANGCSREPESDKKFREASERMQLEGVNSIGLPAIPNHREMHMLHDIYELRDQEGFITYTYLENMNPVVIAGHTALGGKLTYVGQSIGYGIPYSTQYSNPQKDVYYTAGNSVHFSMPQAEPNGLFPPASADGTWVMMKDPESGKVHTVYMEPKVVVSPFKFPMDEK